MMSVGLHGGGVRVWGLSANGPSPGAGFKKGSMVQLLPFVPVTRNAGRCHLGDYANVSPFPLARPERPGCTPVVPPSRDKLPF